MPTTYTAYTHEDGRIIETRAGMDAEEAGRHIGMDGIDIEAGIEEDGRIDGMDEHGRDVTIVEAGTEWPGPL